MGCGTNNKLASNLHSPDFSKPLVLLVKTICYPESTRFYSKACDYILIHETDALHMYKDSMQATHDFFELKKVWVGF